MSSNYDRGLSEIASSPIVPWELYEGKTVMVTGATGLVGGTVCNALLRRNEIANSGIELVLPVRDLPKAQSRFRDSESVSFQAWDAMSSCGLRIDSCDFIIHCASNTDSRLMVEKPVDTILTTLNGTRAMLEMARQHDARMVFVSSMEVYGRGSTEVITEDYGGDLDSMSVRSSYPQSKRAAETLCAAYASQYDVDVCVARLAQTFGPGIADDDRRVFAEFARRCLSGRDIELLTDGSKSNMYVATTDAVCALLLLAAKGGAGEAYNVANEATFCSIWEMANLVVEELSPTSSVTRVYDPEAASRYAVSGYIKMDTSKIRALGWQPSVDLVQMYRTMVGDWDAGSRF